MKELPKSETIGMTEFDLPNNQNPKPHAPIYYGNQSVPHPTNAQAKETSASAVMSAVINAR